MRRLVYGAKNHLFYREKFMTQVRQYSGSNVAQGKGEARAAMKGWIGKNWTLARPTGRA